MGAEALLRWRHPKLGLVPPDEFIPLAEQTGLILPLGAWVLGMACSQLMEWSGKPGLDRLTLAVNVSVRQFRIDDIIAKMQQLRTLGVGFSLDDFGTGYSSLNYLKRLPLDQLKIDQSFARDILTDSNDAAIARMVIGPGDSLHFAVIAEGVKTLGQRRAVVLRLQWHQNPQQQIEQQAGARQYYHQRKQ